ncbi:hypothetical protein [Novispirillum itersonii]|uniref:hypothetical protein n=1 Tax=Novispirillum itersonii TaxID=189 RepID=UPI0003627C78|nr:hypothetical protein [Novispirillum itersonii]
MNVALRALAVGSVVVLAAAAAHAADLSAPAVQVAQAQPAATAEQQPAPAKKQEKPAEAPKAAPAKAETKPEPKPEPKTDAKATDAKADPKAAAPAAAAATAAAAAPVAKAEEKPLPANLSGECAYTGKRIVGLLARDDVDQARKFMDFYRLFSCDEKHIGPTFRCLVNDSTVNASAEDIAARIDRCWTKQD